LIADNQLALQAGWSEELLAQELAWLRDERFDLDLIGFDATELERLLALADGEAESDEAEDEVPDPPEDSVKQAVDQQFARWVMLHVQSNPLPICTRPRVLIKGKRT
jgi:hypothetical protein